MKSKFIKALYITIAFLIISLLGIFSDVAQIFEFNIYKDFFKQYSPHSYIYLIFLYIIIYLIAVLILFVKDVQIHTLSKSDEAILNAMADAFPSEHFYRFQDNLSQTRAVFIDTIEEFDYNASRFLEKDMIISEKNIENAKHEFLLSLLSFIRYTEEYFNPIGNPKMIKFLGGTPEHKMFGKEFEEMENEYLETARKMYNDWIEFQDTLKLFYPDYVWKK